MIWFSITIQNHSHLKKNVLRNLSCVRKDLNSRFIKIALATCQGSLLKILQSLKWNWFHPSSSLINTIELKAFWLFTFHKFQTIVKPMFMFLVFLDFFPFLFSFSCSLTNSINIFFTMELYSIDAGLIWNGCKAKYIVVITIEVSG